MRAGTMSTFSQFNSNSLKANRRNSVYKLIEYINDLITQLAYIYLPAQNPSKIPYYLTISKFYHDIQAPWATFFSHVPIRASYTAVKSISCYSTDMSWASWFWCSINAVHFCWGSIPCSLMFKSLLIFSSSILTYIFLDLSLISTRNHVFFF